MARTAKRDDGLYQKNVIIGRNEDGSYKRRTIYAKTKKELEHKAAELLQQVDSGLNVAEDKTTFKELSDIWVQRFGPKRTDRFRERQTGILKNHLLPYIGSIRVKELKQFHLQDIINEMENQGYATSSMRKVKIVAKQIIEIAYERDIVRRNVFTKVTVPSLDPKERRALTEEEKTLLINTWRGHRMGLGAMIMLYCGLRRGELLALHWDDIDLVNKMISVNKSVTLYHNRPTIKEPKSEAGKRKVPIPNKLCAILSEAPKDNPLVCPSTEGTLMSECAYRRAWNGYLHYLNIQAGGHDRTPAQAKLQVIDNITAHMLRHSYATMLYDAGVDVKSAQKFLGHASLEMTLGVYTHLSRFKQSEAIDSLNAHLDRE